MKKYLKTITTGATLMLALATTAIAQPGKGPQHHREQIESQKIAYITRQLALTPQEAQTFWPVYNQFEAKRKSLRQEFKQDARPNDMNIEQLSDKQATELADGQIIEAQKLIDLRKEYHAQFKSILPPKKVLKLYQAERGFQRVLLGRIKDHRNQGQPKG